MSYSRSLLLYEDRPSYGLILKVIIVAVPCLLLATAAYFVTTGELTGAATLAVECLVLSLIFWAVFPRSYRVYEDHLRIVLGGPLAIKVGFDQLTGIEINSGFRLTVNFVTRVSAGSVAISKKKGMAIAITPNDNRAFIENALNAWERWKRRGW